MSQVKGEHEFRTKWIIDDPEINLDCNLTSKGVKSFSYRMDKQEPLRMMMSFNMMIGRENVLQMHVYSDLSPMSPE